MGLSPNAVVLPNIWTRAVASSSNRNAASGLARACDLVAEAEAVVVPTAADDLRRRGHDAKKINVVKGNALDRAVAVSLHDPPEWHGVLRRRRWVAAVPPVCTAAAPTGPALSPPLLAIVTVQEVADGGTSIIGPTTTDVLIAGAGPTGLTLAVDLARRDVRVRIIDSAASHFVGSRGKGLQERSLEVLADLGVAEQLRTAGWSPPTRVFVNGHLVKESPPSASLILPQSIVEETLRARLAELGVVVELDTALAGFDQSADGVVATTSRGTCAARYLVGCDGGRSTVRKTLGVTFAGSSSANTSVVLGDVEVTGVSREYGHTWIDPQRGMLALTPFRTVPQWQFVAAAADVGEPSWSELRRQFDLFTGLRGVTIGNPTWLSTYHVNVRMTREYRVGRVFLAGDAAHVHPPASGLGMNTGIQDAYNLGWKLARTLAGTASPELLDTYQQERVPIAEWTLRTSSAGLEQLWKAVTSGTGAIDTVTKPEHRQLGLGYRGGPLSKNLMRWDGPEAGDRAPWLQEIGGGFTLLRFGATADLLGSIRGATTRPMPCEQDALVLVRPDGYIGMVAGPADVTPVQDYIDRL